MKPLLVHAHFEPGMALTPTSDRFATNSLNLAEIHVLLERVENLSIKKIPHAESLRADEHSLNPIKRNHRGAARECDRPHGRTSEMGQPLVTICKRLVGKCRACAGKFLRHDEISALPVST